MYQVYLTVTGSESVPCALKPRQTYITVILNAIALITTAKIARPLGGGATLSDADTGFSVAGRRIKYEHGGKILTGVTEALGENVSQSYHVRH